MHVGDKELKSVTQINLPLCHKNFPTIYETVIQVGFVGGISPAFFFMYLHGFLYKHAHTYIHKKKSIWVNLTPDRYRKRNKIKCTFHRNTEIEMNNRTKCLMKHALHSELSATIHFSTLPGSQQGSGTLIIEKLKGISNVLGRQSS